MLRNKKIVDLIKNVQKYGIPANTELKFYKQKTRSSVENVLEPTVQLDSILKIGDITKHAKDHDLELPTSEDYFKDRSICKVF